jgi:hypothetical protein
VFSSIPQTYTDLVLVASARAAIGAVSDLVYVYPNGVGTTMANRWLVGDGSTPTSSGSTANNTSCWFRCNGSSSTANTYANSRVQIQNYASTTAFKPISIEFGAETAATTDFFGIQGALWSSTSAITSLNLAQNSGTNFTNISTFYLYGISNT